jgi:hypothetical protein
MYEHSIKADAYSIRLDHKILLFPLPNNYEDIFYQHHVPVVLQQYANSVIDSLDQEHIESNKILLILGLENGQCTKVCNGRLVKERWQPGFLF